MTPLLEALEIPQRGYHAFRHFNIGLMRSLRVPTDTIQERAGHASTGVFTLDVYGGEIEEEPNLEAARMLGARLEKAVSAETQKAKAASVGSLLAIEEENPLGISLVSRLV